MYRGDGRGGFLRPIAQQIGSGWQVFNALVAGGDFSGDGRPDLIARDAAGLLFMYRGDGRGGFITGSASGSGPAGRCSARWWRAGTSTATAEPT